MIPIPGVEYKVDAEVLVPDELKRAAEEAGFDEDMFQALLGRAAKKAGAESPAVMAGIVQEVCPDPGREYPFSEGDTVYYQKGRGIRVEDLTFMLAENTMGWAPPQ